MRYGDRVLLDENQNAQAAFFDAFFEASLDVETHCARRRSDIELEICREGYPVSGRSLKPVLKAEPGVSAPGYIPTVHRVRLELMTASHLGGPSAYV